MNDILGAAIALAVFLLTVALGAGVIRQSVNGLSKAQDALQAAMVKGQEATQVAIQGLTGAVAQLATASAVNTAQHEDLSRQIAAIQQQLGKHDEQIARLRTQTHLHANKLQEIDPSFQPYRKTEEGM